MFAVCAHAQAPPRGAMGKFADKVTVKNARLKQKTHFMSADEKRLAREMHFDRGMPRAEVAKAMGRDLSCICKLLKQRKTPKPIGRPASLSKEQVVIKKQPTPTSTHWGPIPRARLVGSF